MSATTSRAVRTLAHRVSIDWSRKTWTATPELTAGFNGIQSWVAMADSMATKYAAPPSPIDFKGKTKNIRDTELVTLLESFYKANTPPAVPHVMPEAEKQLDAETLTYIQELDKVNKDLLPVIEAEIEFCERVRTTKETTITDMMENYPLIHEEIENELENRQWFKDIGLDSK